MGRKKDALLAWDQGYKYALHHSADLKQLLELEELLATAKQEKNVRHVNHAVESGLSMLVSEEGHAIDGISNQTSDNHDMLSNQSEGYSMSRDTSEDRIKLIDNSDFCDGISDKARGKEQFSSQTNGHGDHSTHDKLSYESESSNNSTDTCSKSSLESSKSTDLTLMQIPRKMANNVETINNRMDESKKNKFSINRISKSKSISVDFRLSRGIAEVSYDVFNWF